MASPYASQAPHTARRVARSAVRSDGTPRTQPSGGVLVWEGPAVWVAQLGPIPAGALPPSDMNRDLLAAWRGWQGVDLRVSDLPERWATDGLTGLVQANVTSALRRHEHHRTLMLDGPALRALSLPTPTGADTPPEAGFREHPAVAELAQQWAGVWCSHGWINIERGTGRDRIAVTIGLMPWLLREKRYPFLAPKDGSVTALALWHFERLTGTTWTTTPGGVASQLVRATNAPQQGKPSPWWGQTKAGSEPVRAPYDDAAEHPITLHGWCRPAPAGSVVRLYDARRAYLASWSTAKVAANQLSPRGSLPFDNALAGWWLVDLAPWADTRMPHPAGIPDVDLAPDGTCRAWLTTPALELLAQLAEDGTYGGFEVIDAHVAPRAAVLAPAAKVLDTAWRTATAEELRPIAGQSEPAARIARSIKMAYASAHGQWASQWARIKRPDWTAAVIAQGRATTWRKAWRVGLHEDRWPLAIDTDALFYAHDPADPDDRPWPGDGRVRAVKIGTGLGEFSVKGDPIPAQEWNERYAR